MGEDCLGEGCLGEDCLGEGCLGELSFLGPTSASGGGGRVGFEFMAGLNAL